MIRMSDEPGHKASVREEFTEQAKSYANSSLLTDSNEVKKLVEATNISSNAQVLEVASGPGHVGRGFATICDTIVGIDLTEAPLRIAEQKRQESGIKNAHFMRGDAEILPFNNNTFDAVVSRLALHHLETPKTALQEMKRVCHPNGVVAVDDIIVSEHTERGQYQNQFEQIRDPSHVRALPLSELIELLTNCGLEVTNVQTDTLVQNFDDWIDTAQTPNQKAAKAREMIERDEREDLSGTRPFYQDGELGFVQQTAIAVSRPIS